jgi:hypothetical protein
MPSSAANPKVSYTHTRTQFRILRGSIWLLLAGTQKMKKAKYHFPECLNGCCDPSQFEKWLERKARSLRKRDRKRGNTSATREDYKVAIHQAVIRSAGKDEYTGRPLD